MCVPLWNYLWGFTNAQIELICIDTPLTLYGEKKNIPDEKALQETAKEWNSKYGGEGKEKKIKLSDLMTLK